MPPVGFGTFEFRDRKGGTHELVLDRDEAPAIGETYRLGRLTLTRIASLPEMKRPRDFYHVANSLHRWHPDAPRHTKEGKPVFCTRKEINEFTAKDEARSKGKRVLKWD